MSPLEQAQTLGVGIVMLRVGASTIELAWASSTPRLERCSGWLMLVCGLGFMISGALGTVF